MTKEQETKEKEKIHELLQRTKVYALIQRAKENEQETNAQKIKEKENKYYAKVINTWDLWLTVNTSDSHKEFYLCTFDLSVLENSVNIKNCDFFGCVFTKCSEYKENNNYLHMKNCIMHTCILEYNDKSTLHHKRISDNVL